METKNTKNTKTDKQFSFNINRRNLLKKMAWTTPAIIVLGQFLSPSVLKADASGGPDGHPDDGWDP